MLTQIGLKNFGCFSHLSWDNHTNINIIIGENNTGKTYLLKLLYSLVKSVEDYTKRQESDQAPWSQILSEKLFWIYQPESKRLGELVKKSQNRFDFEAKIQQDIYHFAFGKDTKRTILDCSESPRLKSKLNALFIPTKEVLTAFNAISAINERLQIFGFDQTYQDLIEALRLPATQGEIKNSFKAVIHSLEKLMNGEILREKDRFILKQGREKYWMSQTPEGFKKIGIIKTLIDNQTLNQNTILFIDEPEINLHPKAIAIFTKILFQLSQAGVQIYLSTHSYAVIKNLELLARKHQTSILICSLLKIDGQVTSQFTDLQEGMPDNPIIDAGIQLYEEEVRLELED